MLALSPSVYFALITVIAFVVTGVLSVDDKNFDVDDLEVEVSGYEVDPAALVSASTPRKLKGIPDITAEIGKLLWFPIPDDAFTGDVTKYEVNSPLPRWLSFNAERRAFSGVPLSTDKPEEFVSVGVYGKLNHKFPVTHSVFRVNVQDAAVVSCKDHPLKLTIYVDKKLESIKPEERFAALYNLAKFLGINVSAFTLGAQKHFNENADSSVILAGPGNVKNRSSKETSTISGLVGCNNKIWDKYISLIHQLKEQANDGTLSEVLGLPVLLWRVENMSDALERGRRETPISEDNIGDYYDEYGEYEEEDYEELTTILPQVSETSTTSTTTSTHSSETEIHPHRHHHGELPVVQEENIPIKNENTFMTTMFYSTVKPDKTSTTLQSTTVIENREATKTDSFYTIDEEDNDLIDYDDDSETEVPLTVTEYHMNKHIFNSSTTPSVTLSTNNKNTFTESQWTEISSTKQSEAVSDFTTTEKLTTFVVIPSYREETTIQETVPITTYMESITNPNIASSTFIPPSTTTEIITTSTTEELPTTTVQSTITTTTTTTTTTATTPTTTTLTTTIPTTLRTTTMPSTTTTVPTTTTTVTSSMRTTEMDLPKNYPPVINQRLKKIRITAGTVLSYYIPEDTFMDSEDGSNLSLKLLDSEKLPLKKNFWIQFNERTREIYGLPLEEHVSKWEFVVEATDKNGSSVSDTLEVTVQQHKGRRAITHEFTLLMRVEKKNEFPTAVDWQLKTLRGLSSLFQNKDLSQIVVRQIDFSSDFITFTWTNDTLPRSYCPKSELNYLLNKMVANSEGDPSFALSQVMAPELRVKNVEYRGIGQCEEKPEPPVSPPKASPTNFSPIPRNQVDHINAVVGELLVFRVPDDTFYDPEDGDARNLKMSLLTIDRQPLPADHWLQFDVKNQEFFGVPMMSDIGHSEYQLVCEDRGGLTANDGLVVVVSASPKMRYNVEFSMTLETQYESFINSASMKRKFVEKLRDLFRDKDTSHIRISGIMEGSTIVSWHNKTLTTDRCPDKEIKKLRQVLVNDDETYADRVEVIMGPEFPVSAISLTPTGVCQGEFTIVHTPETNPPLDEQSAADASDEYVITFIIPAVIIAIMLALAGIVACVLYRRRRTGKMNVEDDERLNNFRSKGIPVIFQDEIDEKPESGTKAPVILKEEKPPLAPPEYSKSGTPIQPEENNDAPYQPPPPFTSNQDNGRQPRPKPTPTYRKPPPYVPP